MTLLGLVRVVGFPLMGLTSVIRQPETLDERPTTATFDDPYSLLSRAIDD